ncbi:MAG TPA: 2-methylfumaryl-CoA isomerase [Chloroflexi bacterium]|jgi:2-methylfumaryl-CoA isomerase|nr:2-methylfumaryl-CoA isomerase [Chloroflexota bacterium]HCG02959.1 2-methylfumaryl-CoA isomerase [Chloroflexota bacterium]
MGAGILSGLRIVEMSAFVAAPLGGATLAAMGADVIRVDPPGGGIDIGRWPLHRGRSLYWAGLNQGKRSVTIDTRHEAGQEKVAKLIAAPGDGGGIFLTNLPVSGWNSYDELKKLRGDLIMVVITGNRDGSGAVDYTVNAALGFPFITGPEGTDGPVNHVLPAWDAMTGFLAATAILAAERHRRLTGQGQLVELSLSDVGLAVAGHLGLIGEAVLEDEPRGRFGNHVYGTLGRDFVTRDGRRVVVLALTPRQWRSLVEATGLSGEFRNLEARLGLYFNNEGDRWRGRQEICELLQAWIAVRNLSSVASIFDAQNVMWGPYQTFKELVAGDPRASAANPLFADIDHPELGTYPTPGSPLRFGAAAAVPPKSAPKLGEHTEEVLREFDL